MRITLVNPPTLFPMATTIDIHKVATPFFDRFLADEDRLRAPSTLPGLHLGLGSLAASLREDGHEVRIVDGCVLGHRCVMSSIDAILRTEPEFVGLTGPAEVAGENKTIATELRARGFDGVIVQGHDFASLNAVDLLQFSPALSCVIRGEGERALRSLVSIAANGGDLRQVPSLAFRQDGVVVQNPSTAPLSLTDLPLPALDDAEAVIRNGLSLSMATARGCPYHCSFCTTGALPGVLGTSNVSYARRLPPASAARYLCELAADYSVRHMTIVDDLFLSTSHDSIEWCIAFADALIGMDNEISFMVDVRVDSVESGVLGHLKRAGLRKVFIGVESASRQERVGLLNKRYARSSPLEAVQTVRDLGLELVIGFMFFTPTATLQCLGENVEFLRQLGIADYSLFQSLRLYPGTPVVRRLLDSGIVHGEFPRYQASFTDPRVATVNTALNGLLDDIGAELESFQARHSVDEGVSLFAELLLGLAEFIEADEPDPSNWLAGTARRLRRLMRHA
jgi:anaerobic magnesium-protoporphyrin IX monomethyl ester cyclase